MNKHIRVLNLDIDNISWNEALEQITEKGGVVLTPNVDHMVKLQKLEDYYQIYTNADFCLCDSKILLMLSKFLPDGPIVDHIPGSSFFPAYCQHLAQTKSHKRVFLLGGTTDDSMQQAWEKINQQSGMDLVVDAYSPPFGFEKDPQQLQEIISRINDSKAEVLAIGLGSPKQERFIGEHQSKLTHIDTIFGIGATIDFMSGYAQRSPKWMTKFGIEWL